jgi:hypothetical protein
MTAVLAALAFLVFGIALSIVAFLVIVMPAVAIVAVVGWFFQPRRSRSTPPHGHAHSAVTSTGCPLLLARLRSLLDLAKLPGIRYCSDS